MWVLLFSLFLFVGVLDWKYGLIEAVVVAGCGFPLCEWEGVGMWGTGFGGGR